MAPRVLFEGLADRVVRQGAADPASDPIILGAAICRDLDLYPVHTDYATEPDLDAWAAAWSTRVSRKAA